MNKTAVIGISAAIGAGLYYWLLKGQPAYAGSRPRAPGAIPPLTYRRDPKTGKLVRVASSLSGLGGLDDCLCHDCTFDMGFEGLGFWFDGAERKRTSNLVQERNMLRGSYPVAAKRPVSVRKRLLELNRMLAPEQTFTPYRDPRYGYMIPGTYPLPWFGQSQGGGGGGGGQ